ncbi:ArsR/SmtB family transcription factor [Halosolutus halophilus]|uniref:ArsR/SmtB family transcription factor n=1 Tax=Halosolutus halophilus TaxID=1552990 RepID=UPI0022350DF4|nr:helix-turn-helix domain-containing protein [Halosolutus halophilus]
MSRGTEDPTDALEVLGNETRIAILRALAEVDEPLSFSELRERVGIRDSGKFNYHLTRLCEYFVRETDGGYELGPAGTRLIANVEPTGTPLETTSTDGPCPVCGDEGCEKLYHVHLASPGFGRE